MVERYGIWNDSTQSVSGDYLRVNGIELGDVRASADLEYKRCQREHPDNPAFHMRPMFYTGSPYAKEILALHGLSCGEGELL